ncbi:MAG: D-2-hydroxyacid dehydrogenase [Burkholderiaceae bacterium]|nr:D-2-hydroxyacid dehydrogenase [Burkholderiaceae bacterium]
MSLHPWRVVFLDRNTLSPDTTLRPLSFPHELQVYDHTTDDQVAERIAQADVVITNKVRLSRQSIQQAARLKLVAVAATGTDMVDLAACADHGVVVSNIRGYAVNSVPEHVFALMFALRRNIVAYHASVQAGRWQQAQQFCYFDYPISDLAGSTLGIVGQGALGQAVATIGRALGMRVLFAGRKDGAARGSLYTPFQQFLAECDVITLHCPLNADTHHLISDHEFSLMARQPLLINTARGGLVNDEALVQAMRTGQIAGAGIDVVDAEPPPASHPLMSLLDMPNFILTPHIAWASRQAIQALADQLIDNINAFQCGTAKNVVAQP